MMDQLSSGHLFDAEIENEIDSIINEILTDRDGRYEQHRYREGARTIDILYPSLPYEGEKPFRSPDYIRHLLSIYPRSEDLSIVEKIIFRPRYFLSGSIELAALFIKSRGILIEYLHHPHLYETDTTELQHGDDFSFGLMSDTSRLGTGVTDAVKIKLPSTLYYIHLSAATLHNDIDKYFMSVTDLSDHSIMDDLDRKSIYYSNNGY